MWQANYMLFDGYASVFSSYFFGTVLPGAVYNRHLLPRNSTTFAGRTEDEACIGAKCFALTHAVVAGLCLVSVAVAVALARRAIPTYRIFWHIGREEQEAAARRCALVSAKP